jgi:hypothetical protein
MSGTSMPTLMPVLELESDEAGENGGGVELPNHRLKVDKAAGKWMYRSDVAKSHIRR